MSFRFQNPRLYNCAIIFKRAQGKGRIKHITGLQSYMQKFGRAVMVENLLKPGQNRRDWNQTLVSDGFLILRHQKWSVAKELAQRAAVDIQMFAS